MTDFYIINKLRSYLAAAMQCCPKSIPGCKVLPCRLEIWAHVFDLGYLMLCDNDGVAYYACIHHYRIKRAYFLTTGPYLYDLVEL